MLVYNIRRAKYASLSASGAANRWNRKDEYVIYAGNSIALSTLELVAHRAGIKLPADYKLLVIEVKTTPKDITVISQDDLPEDWRSLEMYNYLQKMGSDWYRTRKSLLLQVPSAVVPLENNFIINTEHPDFSKKVSLKEILDYQWDLRLL